MLASMAALNMTGILLLLFLLSPAFVFSVFVDEAYTVDFHYALLGSPTPSNTFFHQPVPDSKASLLYSLSDRAVLAAINPKDGAIVWRHSLSAQVHNSTSDPQFLRVGSDQSLLFTATGSTVSAWTASDGKLVWQNDYAPLSVVALAAQHSSDASVAPAGNLLLALSGSTETVVQLNALTGKLQWSWKDQSDDSAFALLASPGLVHLVSFHSTLLKGPKLKITSLRSTDGTRKAQHTLSTENDIKTPDDVFFVSSNPDIPILAWSNRAKSNLRIHSAGAANYQSFDIPTAANIESINVHTAPVADNLDANSKFRFLVSYNTANDHWADVFEADTEEPAVSKLYDLPSLPKKGTFSIGVADQVAYFVRITQDQTVLIPSYSDTPLATLPTTFQIPGLVETPTPLQAVTEIVTRSSSNHAVRAAVFMSTGDWVLVRNGETSWSRPESLSSISRVEFAALDKTKSLADDREKERSRNILSSFLHRSSRHIREVQNFPLFLRNLRAVIMSRILSSDLALDDDAFGFHKLLIARTNNHRLIALDMGERGRIVWNIDGAGENGKCIPKDATKSIESQLRCLGQLSPSGYLDKALKSLGHYQEPQLSFEQLSGPNKINDELEPGIQQSYFTVQDGQLEGYSNAHRQKIWQFSPPAGHQLISVKAQNKFDPVASIGKVLADRQVLYKYLNPNSVVVLTADHDKRQIIATLLDSASGTVLYSSRHENVDTARAVSSIIFGNTMAFSYTMDSPQDSVSKGYQLVVAEFYESNIPNDRGAMAASSNYSAFYGGAANSPPHVFSHAFHIPEEISQMAVTKTGQGITSRQLLVGLESSSSIVGIPPYVIDPRRTVDKDPSSGEQYEEGLFRYTPMIDFDPKWYLNHQEEILGLDRILTTTSLLESTSLVFAYGLDLFGTRVSPSFSFDILGTNFNKIQLVLTVVGLLAGVFVVAPMIERKQTNTLWQTS